MLFRTDLPTSLRAACFEKICYVLQKCLRHSRLYSRDSHPVVALLDDWSADSLSAAQQITKAQLSQNASDEIFAHSQNYQTGHTYIAKCSLDEFRPDPFQMRSGKSTSKPAESKGVDSQGFENLSNKVSLLINTVNNHAMANVNATWQGSLGLEGGEPNLTVSLTALPHRLGTLHLVLSSIFLQSRKPSRVVLWLPDSIDLASSLTSELSYYANNGLEIRSVKDEIGRAHV